MLAYGFDPQGWFLKGLVLQAVEIQRMSHANVSFAYAK